MIPLVMDNAVLGGEEYTLSFEYRTNVSSLGSLYLLRRSGGNVLTSSKPTVPNQEEWQRYTQVCSWTTTTSNACYAILFPYNTTGWLEVRDGSMQLEKGNRATDWSPAPEDLEAHYEATVNYHTGVPSPTELIYYYEQKIEKTI